MILITGAAGYIGSHCALNFINNNIKDIIIFDNLSTGHLETIKTIQKICPEVKFIQGDLKNKNEISNVFEKYKINTVIHFAACSLVNESVINPLKYYENNVSATLNLLNSMIENDVLKIVFSSTCATYGEPQYVPVDEKHPQKPINPYGKTKLIIEDIMDDYDKAYNLKSIRLRYFNVAGADSKHLIGEWHDNETHLIPNIVKSAFNKKQIFKIYGNSYNTPDGTCIRDYINIEDLAQAHYLAYLYLKNNNKTDIFNLGSEAGTSVQELFQISKKIINQNIPFEIKEKRKGDPAILYANSKKAQKILNWKVQHTIKETIESAYEWEKVLNDIKKRVL